MFGPPKSVAGRRTVSVPEAIRDDLRSHLRNYVGDAPMIYQHATKQRDTTIADALSATTAAARDRARNGHELSQEIN